MKCKNCQQKEHEVIRDTLRYDVKRNVLRCKSCDLVFLDAPDTTKNDYYESAEYRKKYGPDLTKEVTPQEVFDTYYPAQAEIIKEIEPVLRKGMSVMDVGCSTGHFLAALEDKVGTRVGFELSKEENDFIKNSLDFKVYGTPIEETDIAEAPFDLITCMQVLEHIDEPKPFLEAMVSNLKPDGYLFIEVPNLDDILVSTYKNEGYTKFFFHEPHVSYFNEKTLLELLASTGIEGNLKTVQRYSLLNHLNWIMNGTPQKNFIQGTAEPFLIDDPAVPKEIADDFNSLIKEADTKYKKLVNKHKLGESLSFLGKLK